MSLPDPPIWLSEADVTTSVDLPGAVEVLARAFAEEGAGRAVTMAKTMTAFADHGTLHALGSSLRDVVGTKTWAHTPGGAEPLLVLFDASTGAVTAVIEAFALGQLRTAGTAAVATDRLARTDARHMAVIGTGKQALAQVAAVATVRDLTSVRAYGRDAGRCKAFAERVSAELALTCTAVASVHEAVDGADVITLVTRAVEPVLFSDQVGAGVHINAIGAIDLARREFDTKLLGRASVVVTDSIDQVRSLSSELREFYGDSEEAWAAVRSLAEVVGERFGRRRAGDVTLFKGMGSGVEDVAIGAEVLTRARAAGLGRPLTTRARALPTLIRRISIPAGGGRP